MLSAMNKKIRSLAKNRNLLVGSIFILFASLSLYMWLNQQGRPDEMLVAKVSLPAGTQIKAADFSITQLSMGSLGNTYLKPGELPIGSYLLGPIRSGELIAKSRIATQLLDERAPVVVSSAMPLASGLVPGASVDLWATAAGETGPPIPRLLIESAEVASLLKPDGVFSLEQTAVELWVPVAAVPEILAAQVAEEQFGLVVRPTLLDRASW